jgi:hypothetical protein
VRSDSFPYATQTFTVRDTGAPAGTYYRVLATDPAGNAVMSVRSASTTLRPSTTRVRAGGSVTLTARVSGGDGGRVTFREGGRTVGVVVVRDGVARLRVPDLRAGTRVFAATYASGRHPLRATMGKVRVHVAPR